MPTKIGIYFWGCNKLDRLACEYLILSLNKHQSLFEFEVHTPESFIRGPDGRGRIDFDDDRLFGQLRDKLTLYRNEIKEITSDPNNVFSEDETISISEYAIAIIERKVKEEFYYVSDGPLAIISIGDWKKKYAPPSVIEFLLSTIVGAAIGLLDTEDQIPMHVATRGCLFDYNETLETARYSVLVNHICTDCAERIRETFGEDFLREVKTITDRDWIGDPKEVGSVAYNLKRVFYYDLTKTKGFRASLIEKIAQKIAQAVLENVVQILIPLIISLALAALGLAGIVQLIK